MRVIAGTARSLLLKTLPGTAIRPTTDKTKETLFNVLYPYTEGSDFLDLFSGSGAIGIEALSRGANKAVFVENSRAAIACINDNLKHTRLDDRATVMMCDALASIGLLEAEKKQFDVIFIDPPYDRELEKAVLLRLNNSTIVKEDTVIVVEASLKTDFSYLEDTVFEIYKEKKYKANQHIFIRKVEE